MVGSRVSSRIAQRQIKQEQSDGIADNNCEPHTQSQSHRSLSNSADRHQTHQQSIVPQIQTPIHLTQSTSQCSPLIETPKKSLSTRRHVIITSSPSSVEDDELFDGESCDGIDEDDDDDEVIVPTPLKRRSGLSNSRYMRQKRATLVGEVDTARHKLDDLLAHISKGDSHEDDDYDDDDDQTDSSPHMKRRRPRSHKKDRKTAKEDGFTKTSSFVLKLFDRSVDLAQFSLNTARDDAPLYPVCRSWMRNNIQLPNLYEPPSVPHDDNQDLDNSGPCDDKPSGIYHLPKPLPKPRDKFGKEFDPRIPECVREYKKSESQADVSINSLANDSFNTLLTKNLTHWKKVRHEWHNSSLNNELRYKHSCDVLKSMFEKSLNGQTDQLSKPQTVDSVIS